MRYKDRTVYLYFMQYLLHYRSQNAIFIIQHAPYMTYIGGYTEWDIYFLWYNSASLQWIITVNNLEPFYH